MLQASGTQASFKDQGRSCAKFDEINGEFTLGEVQIFLKKRGVRSSARGKIGIKLLH